MTILEHVQALYRIAKGRHCWCRKRLNGADEWVVLQECGRCRIVREFEASEFHTRGEVSAAI